jgi:predicted cupin superfamily sugar epimerase
MLSARDIIELLRLEPLAEEGGYYCETYRSELVIPASTLPADYGGSRNVSTAIYYLLTPQDFSAIHRVRSDEVFHFYAGEPVEMLQLLPDGSGQIVDIGSDLLAGQSPQVIVPAGIWQGARLASGGRWALLGTTVAPGFEFADYEHADRGGLLARYPEFGVLITALTRG